MFNLEEKFQHLNNKIPEKENQSQRTKQILKTDLRKLTENFKCKLNIKKAHCTPKNVNPGKSGIFKT